MKPIAVIAVVAGSLALTWLVLRNVSAGSPAKRRPQPGGLTPAKDASNVTKSQQLQNRLGQLGIGLARNILAGDAVTTAPDGANTGSPGATTDFSTTGTATTTSAAFG